MNFRYMILIDGPNFLILLDNEYGLKFN